MIAIVSSVAGERTAFAALCEAREWPVAECDSVAAFGRLLRRARPKVALVRHRVSDGYSDDVMRALAKTPAAPATRLIVLIAAGTPSEVEARQIALGADCVLRDPVRVDVLAAYLEKYCRAKKGAASAVATAPSLVFAGAVLHAAARTLSHNGGRVALTPREVQLAELLVQSEGEVVSYETLFGEILGRRFRGDTSNMRVLLGKLARSLRALDIDCRQCVEVIPKSGYRYRTPKARGRARVASRASLSAAA